MDQQEVGKGTVTKIISNKLGLINIDTGSTYRCVALEVLNQNVNLEDKEKIIEIANTIKINIQNSKDGDKVFKKKLIQVMDYILIQVFLMA